MTTYDGSHLLSRSQERIGRFLIYLSIVMGLVGLSYAIGYEVGTATCQEKHHAK